MIKAAIFADVTRRNALRRANGLPPFDVHAQYAHEVAIAAQAEFRAFCDEHIADQAAIREQVLAELQAKHLGGPGPTMAEKWAVGREVRRRFIEQMTFIYGKVPEVEARNSVVYGEASRDTP